MSLPGPHDAREDRRGTRRRLVAVARVAVVAAIAVVVAGLVMVVREPRRSTAVAVNLSGGSSPGVSSTPTVARVALSATGTASSPVGWQVRLGVDRGRDAVLLAYQAYVGTVVRLSEEPDPDDVALPQVALDPQLSALRRALAGSAAAGTSRRGRVLATARVAALRGDQAVVVGCVDTAAQRLYAADGRPMPRWHGGPAVSTVNMRLDDGRWKVYLLASRPAARCQR